jgi:putative ABC transport system ATP-binding protein
MRLEGITKVFRSGDQDITALRGIDVEIAAGEFLAVMGPSGSGKSTLLSLLGCLDQPTSGRYALGGHTVTGLPDPDLARIRNRTIGFIFQGFHLVPDLTVVENVELPLLYEASGRDRRQRAVAALNAVSPGVPAWQRAAHLSAGEQQRVAIARAVVLNPPIILADEPTGSLDAVNGNAILRLLSMLHREGRTVIVVTHNPLVARCALRSLRLEEGVLGEAA